MGRKSIAFINSTQMPVVSASGAMNLRSPWKMPLTCSLTKSMVSSTNACVFDGTPAVALRVTIHMRPNATTPRKIDVTTVSTFTLQKPPASLALVRKVRWCWMYDVGVSALSAAIPGSLLRQSRTKNAVLKITTVITKAVKNAAGTISR